MRSEYYLPIGTRVRLKPGCRAMGWHGKATMLAFGRAIKDGRAEAFGGTVEATREQWAVMRDQTPNPEHAAVVEEERRLYAEAGSPC